jgi:cytochrome c biogenesis protein CcmG/thiol:disulfide interchange protein DsbE
MRSDRRAGFPQLTRRAVLQAGALGLLGWETLRGSFAYAHALRIGEPAPPATLVTLDGRRISTSDLLGQVVILTFWATWCVPCRKELPVLSTYTEQHASQGLTVLGFSLDSPDELRLVKEMARSLIFPVGLLAHSSAPGYGRIWRMPANFTIDRKGRLIDNAWKDKQPTWTLERLERIVAPLLNAAT